MPDADLPNKELAPLSALPRLIPCGYCEREVAKGALTCPHCGALDPSLAGRRPNPEARRDLTYLVVGAIVLFIFVYIFVEVLF